MILSAKIPSRNIFISIKKQASKNRSAKKRVKSFTVFGDIFLDGNSRLEVLGFNLSKFSSTNRLNPIAAFRALTMQIKIKIILFISSELEKGDSERARITESKAKGRANSVCENLTNLPKLEIVCRNFIFEIHLHSLE